MEWTIVVAEPASACFGCPCDLCVRTEHRERGGLTLTQCGCASKGPLMFQSAICSACAADSVFTDYQRDRLSRGGDKVHLD
jgi:hypothetical protein